MISYIEIVFRHIAEFRDKLLMRSKKPKYMNNTRQTLNYMETQEEMM